MTETLLIQRLQQAAGGRSYREVGELTGLNQETVRRYMQGLTPPSVEFVTAFGRTLGLSAEWVLTGRGPMKASDLRAHALQAANTAELLAAVAETLETLISRVERIEVFLNTLETRLRAGRGERDGAGIERTQVHAPPAREPVGDAVASGACADAR